MSVTEAGGDRPLSGLRVLVPRAPAQAPALSGRVRALGGEPVEAPVLSFEAGDVRALEAALGELADGAFAGVCLTSPNGVAAVADALERLGLDGGTLAGDGTTVGCIGAGTAGALADRLGVRPDLVPETSTTAALGDALAATLPPGGGRVLLPRADIASPALGERLAAGGHEPVEVAAYRTVVPPALPDGVPGALAAGRIDLLPFASSSTVENFLTLLDGRPWRGTVVSIGPVTSATCREHGIEPAVEADQHDLDGLVDALCEAAAAG